MIEYSLHGFDFINKSGESKHFSSNYLKNKQDRERFHRYTILLKNTNCEIVDIGKSVKSSVTLRCNKHNTVNTTKISLAKVHFSCSLCRKEDVYDSLIAAQQTIVLKIKEKLPQHVKLIPSVPFSDDYYSNVVCEKHGESTVNNKSLKNSPYGCPRCGKIAAGKDKVNSSKILFEQYMENNDRYDYSLVVFTGVRKKVKIICNVHGVFEQQPYVHMKGHGCLHCGIITGHKIKEEKGYSNNFGRSSYSKTKGDSNLYVLKIVSENELFYKIGIAKNVKARMKAITKEVPSYSCLMLLSIPFEPASAWDIEKVLHFDNKNYRYEPLNKFVGSTECFSNIDLDNILKLCQCCL